MQMLIEHQNYSGTKTLAIAVIVFQLRVVTGTPKVHNIQMLQLFGKECRAEGLMTADVDTSQKNHKCHSYFRVNGGEA